MQNKPHSGKIVLAGNPNVGKSTLFNLLTGKRFTQATGAERQSPYRKDTGYITKPPT